ncbi:MAG: DNA-formamidopyrimidine glycosylase family protein [Rudaea sp.]
MFELPEYVTLAKQCNETLKGKVVEEGSLGNLPHKFVWYNREPGEFKRLAKGKRVGKASTKGRWLFMPLEPGYILVLGECGGKLLYHPDGTRRPDKYHLLLEFDDGSALTATTQMWGAMELHEKGQERKRKYIADMRTTPIDAGFTFEYLNELIDEVTQVEKTSVKALLTQHQLIPGLGNAIAQDILFRGCLHPKHPVEELTRSQKRQLYNAITKTVEQAIKQGGRCDEYDLYGNPGKYVRLMDKNALGRPCPQCGRPIEKMQYLGGACYYCPGCQR